MNGVAAVERRGLRQLERGADGQYPAEVFNINNAATQPARDHRERSARNDNGDYKIRIYTIGMGELVRYNLGTMPETPETF